MLKKMYLGQEFIGNVGKETGVKGLKVGDVVNVIDKKDKRVSTTFIVNYKNDTYSLMGWGYQKLHTFLGYDSDYEIKKVMSGSLITTEILNDIRSSSTFKVTEIEPTKMTLQEIEEKLGFPVKVII